MTDEERKKTIQDVIEWAERLGLESDTIEGVEKRINEHYNGDFEKWHRGVCKLFSHIALNQRSQKTKELGKQVNDLLNS